MGSHTLDAPSRKKIIPKSSISQYLIAFLILTFQLQYFSRYQGVPNLGQRALSPLYSPPVAEFFFVPEASTLGLLCLMAYLISTFQLLYFPRYQRFPNLHQGALGHLDAPQRIIFCTESENCTISNCAFNLNYLALVIFEILGVPNLRQGVLCTPVRTLAAKCCTRGEYYIMSNDVFNFNFLALVLSEVSEI